MAQMTIEQMTELRDDLQAKYDASLVSPQSISIKYGDYAETFQPADWARLERRIAELNRAIDRANGCGGAIFIALGG